MKSILLVNTPSTRSSRFTRRLVNMDSNDVKSFTESQYNYNTAGKTLRDIGLLKN